MFHAAWEARVHSVEELTHYRTGGHGPEPVGLCCMQSDFTPAEIAVMATRAGLVIPEEDLAPVAKALSAHFKRVEPLMALELSSVEPAVLFDPRWHD